MVVFFPGVGGIFHTGRPFRNAIDRARNTSDLYHAESVQEAGFEINVKPEGYIVPCFPNFQQGRGLVDVNILHGLPLLPACCNDRAWRFAKPDRIIRPWPHPDLLLAPLQLDLEDTAAFHREPWQ